MDSRPEILSSTEKSTIITPKKWRNYRFCPTPSVSGSPGIPPYLSPSINSSSIQLRWCSYGQPQQREREREKTRRRRNRFISFLSSSPFSKSLPSLIVEALDFVNKIFYLFNLFIYFFKIWC